MTLYPPRKIVASVAVTVAFAAAMCGTWRGPRGRVTVRGKAIPPSGAGQAARPAGVAR